MNDIRWMAFIPAHTPNGTGRKQPYRALAVILAPTRLRAEGIARVRWGAAAQVQSVLAAWAEADDLSAVRRTRHSPPVSRSATYDERTRKCLTCGLPTKYPAIICSACNTPEKRALRRKAAARARYAEKVAERAAVPHYPCAAENCTVPVLTEGKYCGSHAGMARRRAALPRMAWCPAWKCHRNDLNAANCVRKNCPKQEKARAT